MAKSLVWMGTSLEDLKELPPEVRTEVGHALREAQEGGKSRSAKPLRGEGYGASVLEIVEDFASDTFRCVYTVKFEEAIYVLHSFQKKSSHGIKTQSRDIDIIKARLKDAEELHRQWVESQKRNKKPPKAERSKRRK